MEIDSEIKNLIPPLKPEEYQGLEQKILKEGLIEPLVIWKEQDILLDGHHRFKICEKHNIKPKYKYISFNSREGAINWVIDNQLSRRNLDPFEASVLRGKKYLLEKKSHGGQIPYSKRSVQNEHSLKTRDKVAQKTGVSPLTIERDAQLAEAVEELTQEIPKEVLKQNPKKDIITLYKKPKEEKQAIIKLIKEKNIHIKPAITEVKRKKIAQSAKNIKSSKKWNIYHGDIKNIKLDKQYDFIITDPPYPKEYLSLWGILAKRAKEWLKPNGLLIAMSGQLYLNQIYSIFDKHLTYYWTACYLTPGQPTPLRTRQVNTTWKPILIYGLNDKYKGKIFGDVYKSPQPAKKYHDWEQSVEGLYSLIKQISLPGQSILDPFCGSGSVGVAALKYGCFFDGVDIDEESVNIAKRRLYDTKKI